MKHVLFVLATIAAVTLAPSWGLASSAERMHLTSRIQSMSHGYHSDAEWQDIFSRVAELRARAEREGNLEEVVELNVLEAMVQADMRGAPDKALALLKRTRERYYGQPVENLKRVYVETARIHARQGNERAISDLIEEFQKSPHFDPVTYPFTGGYGREVPLMVVRPRATGQDSITVTTMQRYRTQARFAPGRTMPEIAGVDHATGREVRLSDYRGNVVLVDFWFPGFVAWERDASNLAALHRTYRPGGFEIIGVPLGRDEQRVQQAIRRHGLAWPQIQVERHVPGQFGIFGDARNFLVDRNGVIVGRDLRGSDLAEALRVMMR